MPRTSPQTDRLVAVIELLMAHPAEGMTLSEIARRLAVNKPSCHALLGSLTDHGWLLRHPTRKTYRLGPGLISAGQVAAAHLPGVELLRTQVQELADRLAVSLLVFQRSDDQLTLVDQRWDPRGSAAAWRIGHRLPLRAPLGSVFIAWAGEAAVAAWLQVDGGGQAAAAPGRRARWEAGVAAVRRRGFSVERVTDPAEHQLRAALERLHGHDDVRDLVTQLLDEPDLLLGDLDPERLYPVGAVSAPVFDRDAQVVLAVALTGWPEPLPGADIDAVGRQLRARCDAATRLLGGVVADPG